MGAVRNLCNCGVVLEEGRVSYIGDISNTIKEYLLEKEQISKAMTERHYNIDESKPFQIEKVEIINKTGKQMNVFEALEEIIIRFFCISKEEVPKMYGCFFLKNENNEEIIVCDSMEAGTDIFNNMTSGQYAIELVIPKGILSPGEYILNLGFASEFYEGFSIEQYLNIMKFTVRDSLTERGNKRGSATTVILPWKIIKTP
jgi:lipopolysaccharide transport system ATP-binding protein